MRSRWGYPLPHLDFAALRAISERVFLESFFALAGPPFNPPRRPRATAAGFLGGLFLSVDSCVASATICEASTFKSDDLFFLAMP